MKEKFQKKYLIDILHLSFYFVLCPSNDLVTHPSALDRLTELWNYEKYGCPKHYGDSYYYFHNSGLQPQSILYKIPFSSSVATPEPKPEVFLDPNTLSSDGTVALGSFSFSENGKYFGYTLSKSGSDWSTIHVKRCDDKFDLVDKIDFVKFSGVSWVSIVRLEISLVRWLMLSNKDERWKWILLSPLSWSWCCRFRYWNWC